VCRLDAGARLGEQRRHLWGQGRREQGCSGSTWVVWRTNLEAKGGSSASWPNVFLLCSFQAFTGRRQGAHTSVLPCATAS
jgi:hypothetical protein